MERKTFNLKWCAFVVGVITLLSLIPQINFWFVRGSQWHGTYATFQGDEFLYSTYINARIDGRPRRNDPPGGIDHTAQSPLPESLFSIQFFPPLIISSVARLFGASASSTFIALAAITGLLSSLSLYWLLTTVSGDARFAAVGVLVVLCLGTLVAGEGLFGLLVRPVETSFLGFPFLRRYLPSAAFPMFFIFCALVWKALAEPARAVTKALLAGAVLCLLVFSYFYLWTAAVAWFLCIAILWFIALPSERRVTLSVFGIVASMLVIALGLYAWLLSHRALNIDEATLLRLTHRPDLFRVPEIIGALVLVTLFVAKRRRYIRSNNSVFTLAASFLLLPFVVFNQQVVTGRSMQPYHYEVFVANYAVLIGCVLSATCLFSLNSRRVILLVGFCILWGFMEVNLPFQTTSDAADDETVPVLLRLKELSKHDGTWVGLRTNGKTPTTVFSPEIRVMRLLPTWAPQSTLPEIGSGSFRSPSRNERKETLFVYLYFCDQNRDSLQRLLSGEGGDGMLEYYVKVTLFGPDRLLPFLTHDFSAIRNDEIRKELDEYQKFLDTISADVVRKRPLTYLVTLANNGGDLPQIDRWYKRDEGEVVGSYKLYRLELRN